jgi:hypothetical protein
MNQTYNTSSSLPNLSPDFNSWLDKEKADARRHQRTMLKFALFFIGACLLAFVLFPGDLLRDMVQTIASPARY